jgi:hypothetical protein
LVAAEHLRPLDDGRDGRDQDGHVRVKRACSATTASPHGKTRSPSSARVAFTRTATARKRQPTADAVERNGAEPVEARWAVADLRRCSADARGRRALRSGPERPPPSRTRPARGAASRKASAGWV